jgi:hypothetical protein
MPHAKVAPLTDARLYRGWCRMLFVCARMLHAVYALTMLHALHLMYVACRILHVACCAPRYTSQVAPIQTSKLYQDVKGYNELKNFETACAAWRATC